MGIQLDTLGSTRMLKLIIFLSLVTVSFVRAEEDIEKDTTYYGNDLVFGSHNKQPSLDDCKKSCKENVKCKYWTYLHSKGYCFLKTKRENVKELKGATSGSVDGKKKTGTQNPMPPVNQPTPPPPQPKTTGKPKQKFICTGSGADKKCFLVTFAK